MNYSNISAIAGGIGWGHLVTSAEKKAATIRQGENYTTSQFQNIRQATFVSSDAISLIMNLENKSILFKSVTYLCIGAFALIYQKYSVGLAYLADCSTKNRRTLFDYGYLQIRDHLPAETFEKIQKYSKAIIKHTGTTLLITQLAISAIRMYLGNIYASAGTFSIVLLRLADKHECLPTKVSTVLDRILPHLAALGMLLGPNFILLRLLGLATLITEIAPPILNLFKNPIESLIKKTNAELDIQYPSMAELEKQEKPTLQLSNANAINNFDVHQTPVVLNPTHINTERLIDLDITNINIDQLTEHFECLTWDDPALLAAMSHRLLNEAKGSKFLDELWDFPETKPLLEKVIHFENSGFAKPIYKEYISLVDHTVRWKAAIQGWPKYKNEDLNDPNTLKTLKLRFLEDVDYIQKELDNNRASPLQWIVWQKNKNGHFAAKKPHSVQMIEEGRNQAWDDYYNSKKISTPRSVPEIKIFFLETKEGVEHISKDWEAHNENLQKVIEQLEEGGYRFIENRDAALKDWEPIVKLFAQMQMKKLTGDLSGRTRPEGNLSRFDITVDRAKSIIAYFNQLDSSLQGKEAIRQRKAELLIPLLCEAGDYCVTGIEEAVENAFSSIFADKNISVSSLETRFLHMLYERRKNINSAFYSALRQSVSGVEERLLKNVVLEKGPIKKDGDIDLHNMNTFRSLVGPDSGTASASVLNDQTIGINPFIMTMFRLFVPHYRYAFWSENSNVVETNGKRTIQISKKLIDSTKESMDTLSDNLTKIISHIKTLNRPDIQSDKDLSIMGAFTLPFKLIGSILYELVSNCRSYLVLLNKALVIMAELVANDLNIRYNSTLVLDEITDGFDIYYTKQQYRDWWTAHIKQKVLSNRKDEDLSAEEIQWRSAFLSDDSLFENEKPRRKYLTIMLMELGILKKAEQSSPSSYEKVEYDFNGGFKQTASAIAINLNPKIYHLL